MTDRPRSSDLSEDENDDQAAESGAVFEASSSTIDDVGELSPVVEAAFDSSGSDEAATGQPTFGPNPGGPLPTDEADSPFTPFNEQVLTATVETLLRQAEQRALPAPRPRPSLSRNWNVFLTRCLTTISRPSPRTCCPNWA